MYLTLFEINSFVVSTNKTVFQWGDWLSKIIYHLAVTRLKLWVYKALYDIYKSGFIIFEEEGLETIQKIFRIFVDSFFFMGPLLSTG